MAYPPPVPPATRTNATVMATNHPADHNLTSAALTEILNHIATLEASIYPIGTITMSGASIPPGNHAVCAGQLLSKTEYPEVFALLGTKFGAGDATNFTMPDYRGRFPIGYNTRPGDSYMISGVGETYGSPNAILVDHDHIAPDHFHQLGTLAVVGVGNHWHQPSNAGGFVASGGVVGSPPQGFLRDAVITPGAGAYLELGGTGDAGAHGHALTGFPGVADRVLTTTRAGQGATNANLPPCLSVNFVMRMH